MGLDYSQKRLISAGFKGAHGARAKRLQRYAFFTGLASTLISLVQLIVIANKG